MKSSLIVLFNLVVFSTTLTAGDRLFEIQAKKPTANVGDYVLCPARQFYDSAVEKGVDKTTFIYYTSRMVEAGDEESTVTSLAGTTYSLPNEFIISIPRGQTAKVGDIVLTWWQSGSGMQRAIVVGGSNTEPMVRYLDIAYENPSGAGKKEDKLRPDSFYVLSKPFQIGTTVAINTGRQQRFGHLLAMDDNKVLVQEFAGKLKLYDRKLAIPMPMRPEFTSGSAADAALFGGLKPITVVKVDSQIGRVFATYQFGRTQKEKAFSFGEVMPR